MNHKNSSHDMILIFCFHEIRFEQDFNLCKK